MRAAWCLATAFATMFGTALLAQGPANLNPPGTNGNILQPGIPLRGGNGRFAPAPGSAAGPVRAGGAGRGTGRRGLGGGGAVIVPYPVYGQGFDGFYGGYTSVHNPPPGQYDPIFGGYTPAPQSGYFASGGLEQGQTPTVVINQNFQSQPLNPQLRDYSNVALPEPGGAVAAPPAPQQGAALADDQPTVFLVALKDHTILPTIAYWVQGDTLHYVSVDTKQGKIDLSQVDRPFSQQLNAERQVPFHLPAPPK